MSEASTHTPGPWCAMRLGGIWKIKERSSKRTLAEACGDADERDALAKAAEPFRAALANWDATSDPKRDSPGDDEPFIVMARACWDALAAAADAVGEP